jgi:hypothetical protein
LQEVAEDVGDIKGYFSMEFLVFWLCSVVEGARDKVSATVRLIPGHERSRRRTASLED